jgi:hypothetical protein
MESIRVAMETKDRVGFVLEFHDTMRLARILNRLEGLSWSQDNINLFNNKIDSLDYLALDPGMPTLLI